MFSTRPRATAPAGQAVLVPASRQAGLGAGAPAPGGFQASSVARAWSAWDSLEGSPRLHRSGTTITISFIGAPPGNGPSDARYLANAVGDRRAVAFTIRTISTPAPATRSARPSAISDPSCFTSPKRSANACSSPVLTLARSPLAAESRDSSGRFGTTDAPRGAASSMGSWLTWTSPITAALLQ